MRTRYSIAAAPEAMRRLFGFLIRPFGMASTGFMLVVQAASFCRKLDAGS
jgi:hypothetical protein